MPHTRADPSRQRKSVAVIGGGLAGLAAAKAAAQVGLFPTIFDRRPSIGGMWGDSAASTYASLHTNVSRFTCSFSDFPWPPGSPDFPTAAEVGEYLSAYQRAFLSPPDCRLQLGCEVLRVLPPIPSSPDASDSPGDQPGPTQSPSWSVEWREAAPLQSADTTAPPQTRRFDFVAVASGFCAVPYIPPIPGLDAFPGLVLHSAAYRGPHSLVGRRRVAVVGSGHSATDIAADLAAAAASAAAAGEADSSPPMEVVHVTPRPFWVIPRYLPLEVGGGGGGAASAFAPLDVMLYRWSKRAVRGRASPDEEWLFPSGEDHVKANAFWSSVCGDQGSLLSPALAIPPASSQPPVVAISDSYGPLLASGRLRVHRGRLHRVSGSTLELSDGPAADDTADAAPPPNPEPPLSDVDAILMCTGMRPSLHFLPPGLLETLSYTPYDSYLPLALHRQVLHPDLPGLAFVGVFRSPFFAMVELQARLAAAAFVGELPAAEADPAAQRAGVALELRVRQHVPRTPYPYTDYVGHADGLAAALGVRPPAEWRAEGHDVVIAAHYAALPGPLPPPVGANTAVGIAVPDDEAAAVKAKAAGVAAAGREESDGAVAAVRQALEDVATAMQEYGKGRRVASAVFHDLAGEWILRRRIVSRFASSPSGEVTGRARFVATATTADTDVFSPAAGGAGGLSYLYEEQGQFAMHSGATMRVRREYVYMYDSTADRIDVYFAEGGSKRGAFFHSLRFLAPDEPPAVTPAVTPALGRGGDGCGPGDGGAAVSGTAPAAPAPHAAASWRAVGEHLCIRDMYEASYKFCFQGIRLREFQIEFLVRGPKKDYTATATYTRP